MSTWGYEEDYAAAFPAERRAGALFVEPVFTAAGVVFLLMIPPTLAAMLADDRLHLGLDIWLKPMKFQVALAIFAFTMAVYARWLPAGMVGRRWHRLYVASVVAAMGAEILWIAGAAALGTISHFNETPVGMAFYAAAGVLAVWFTGATLVYGVLIARNRRPGFDPALRWGLALGLVLTFVLSVAFAGYMSNSGSHFVGAATSDVGGLWPMAWSRVVGICAWRISSGRTRCTRCRSRGSWRAWCWRGGRRSGRPGGSRRSGRRSLRRSSRRRWRGAVAPGLTRFSGAG